MDILQYIGVDYHPYQQSIAFVDTTGEIITRRFFHTEKTAIGKFYKEFPAGSVVGVEAGGQMRWFEKLLDKLSLELRLEGVK